MFVGLVEYSHLLKSESSLLTQHEFVFVPVCIIYMLRKPNSLPVCRRERDLLVMFVLGEMVHDSSECVGHLEALTFLV